jgi:hypothetical protein
MTVSGEGSRSACSDLFRDNDDHELDLFELITGQRPIYRIA